MRYLEKPYGNTPSNCTESSTWCLILANQPECSVDRKGMLSEE